MSQSAETDAPRWPTEDEWPDLTRAADVLRVLCDCGVPEGESEATDPRDRSVRLPHHFDCSAVTAWRALSDAGYRVIPPVKGQS